MKRFIIYTYINNHYTTINVINESIYLALDKFVQMNPETNVVGIMEKLG